MLSIDITARAKSSETYSQAIKDVIAFLENSDIVYNGVHYAVSDYDKENKIAHNDQPENEYWRGRRAALMDSYNGLRHIVPKT